MENNKKNAKIEDKHFDGIIEHDHPLPRWWLMIFWGTIVFSIFYYGYYEIMNGPNLDQELNAEMAVIESKINEGKGAAANGLLAQLENVDFITSGQKIYAEKCLMCHGDKGQGLIGPNLTDNFWIHGQGKPEAILEVIQKGVAAKGMPGWETILSSDEQIAISAFVYSLKGQNIPGPKPAEGEEVP